MKLGLQRDENKCAQQHEKDDCDNHHYTTDIYRSYSRYTYGLTINGYADSGNLGPCIGDWAIHHDWIGHGGMLALPVESMVDLKTHNRRSGLSELLKKEITIFHYNLFYMRLHRISTIFFRKESQEGKIIQHRHNGVACRIEVLKSLSNREITIIII